MGWIGRASALPHQVAKAAAFEVGAEVAGELALGLVREASC